MTRARPAPDERNAAIDEAGLTARARGIGDAAVRRALDRIAAGIAQDYPALALEREIAALRVSGAVLRGLARRDVRLRVPELWLDRPASGAGPRTTGGGR